MNPNNYRDQPYQRSIDIMLKALGRQIGYWPGRCKLCGSITTNNDLICSSCCYYRTCRIQEEEMKTYTVRVQSQFILTPTQIKEKLGTGYKVVECIIDKDTLPDKIETVDQAVQAIIITGYRALARAHHPDLGGSTETMMILNRSKKELCELLESLKG